MKNVFILIMLMALVSCTTVQKTTNISIGLDGKQFNSISSKFMSRPTFTSIEDMSTGETVLTLEMDNYGVEKSYIRFSKDHVSDYLSLIEKYEEWEYLAKSRGDIFTKEIGRAYSWNNGLTVDLRFNFHSGNKIYHYLSLSTCAAGTCLDKQSVYLDKKNVAVLKHVLVDLRDGKITQKDLDSVYK